jgi:hypothetical protein
VDRRQLLQRLDTAWGAFEESYAGLSDAQLQRHPRAREHVGRGGVDAPAAHPGGRHATAVLRQVRRHRCLQRPHDGAESAPVAPRGATATGRHPSPAHRLHPEGARGSAQPGDALPSPPTARHLRPLPAARRGDTAMATKRFGVSEHPSTRRPCLRGEARRLVGRITVAAVLQILLPKESRRESRRLFGPFPGCVENLAHDG